MTRTSNVVGVLQSLATLSVVLGLMAFAPMASGQGWYNSAWQYRKAITVNSGQVPSTQTNFPMLVSLASDSDLAAHALSSGYDILFTDSSGTTKLSYERELYNSSSGQLAAWVMVPSLSSGTVVYMYFGNSSASDQQNPGGTWDSNYKAVYHFPNGTTLSANDSTANGKNGTISSATATTGQIGGAAAFTSASDGKVTLPALNLFNGQAFTVSGWMNQSALQEDNVLLYSCYSQATDECLHLVVRSGTPWMGFFGDDLTGGSASSTGTWYHLTFTYDGSHSRTIYLNGTAVASGSSGGVLAVSSGTVASTGGLSFGTYTNAAVDELEISGVVRSANWITTEYNNQSLPGSFFTEGSLQNQGGGGGTVATPTFSPVSGTYSSAQTVAIATSTSGATIRYTTDGSTPSETHGTVYGSGIYVSGTTTIKAIAYEAGYSDSSVASAAYTISSGGGGVPTNLTTTYTYDVLNHLTSVSMPRSTGTQTRSWSYSGAFLMSATNPENGTVSYTYGSNNKVATRTDAKGQVVAYSYDSMARLTEVQRYPSGMGGGEDTCQRETYYYDNNNPIGSGYPQLALGRLSAVQYQGGNNPNAYGACDTTFTELYNYGTAGAPTGKQLVVSRGGGSFALAATYTYDGEGRTTAETYPTDNSGNTANLSYTFDSMGRLNTMTDNIANRQIIQGATYGPANETLSITGGSYSGAWAGETRTYNSLKQLTQVQESGAVNISYSYPSTGNNGKIQSQTDNLSGETVTYTYDALNRLATAENQSTFSPSWGQSFSYDGFGNLINTSVIQGSAPSMAATYDANNHAGGEDANGNPGYIQVPALGSSVAGVYDVENRLAMLNSGCTVMCYSYDPANKRVWRGSWNYNGEGAWTRGTDEVTFWSVSGRKLATYNVTQSGSTLYCTQTGVNLYFGGKLIKNNNGWVYSDRLGSIGKFYPYGIERPSATTNGTEKFTGYFRDSETGNDYAVNRYESPGTGRFLTPDRMSGSPANPGSWNKYAYVTGDPVNRVDRQGTDGDDDGDDDGSFFDSGDDGASVADEEELGFIETSNPSSPCYGQLGQAITSDCGAWLDVMFPGVYTASTAGSSGCGGGYASAFVPGEGGSAGSCDPTAPSQVNPTCDQLLAQWIDVYLSKYRGMTGTGSPLASLTGAYFVQMGEETGVDPAFILGIARSESSLATNPNVKGGKFNVYGNSLHFSNNLYTNYADPTMDAFDLISSYIAAGVGASTSSMYANYEGESATNPVDFQRQLGTLNQTDSALFGNLSNVGFTCDATRQNQLTAALGLQ